MFLCMQVRVPELVENALALQFAMCVRSRGLGVPAVAAREDSFLSFPGVQTTVTDPQSELKGKSHKAFSVNWVEPLVAVQTRLLITLQRPLTQEKFGYHPPS